VVDIREPDERTHTGTISGVVHAPRGMLEFYADPASPYHRQEFEPARRTLVYCASGGRSALAVAAPEQLGCTVTLSPIAV
jgi:rhodanese-related sulfurtransferase